MAVTKEGIPVRVWTFEGTTSDQVIIRKVKDDLGAWGLHRVIWCLDRGFNSEKNRRYLQRAGGHYIVGERLRSDSIEREGSARARGRYRSVDGNLGVKEVRVGTERFVVCHNPSRQGATRSCASASSPHLGERIAGSDNLSTNKAPRALRALCTKPGLRTLFFASHRTASSVSTRRQSAKRRTSMASSSSGAPTNGSRPRRSRSATRPSTRPSAAGGT